LRPAQAKSSQDRKKILSQHKKRVGLVGQFCGKCKIRETWFRLDWAKSDILSPKWAEKKGWRCGSSVEYLPTKYDAPSSNSSNAKKRQLF
jgi:hypothetical protein